MTDSNVFRWGILGSADIARSAFIPGVRDSDTGQVYAIGSRSLDKAQAFAEEHDIPNAYDSYDAVLEDPNVDGVYIPLPNTLHAEWIIKAAQAGKPVFCEKPMTMTTAEAMEAVDACKKAGIPLVEAFVYRFHPQTLQIRKLLDEGIIGDVLHTEGRFHYSFRGSDSNIRLRPEVGGGARLDIGCYPLSYTRFVMGEAPQAISATMVEDEPSGVDKTTVATLRFSGGRTANISGGIRMAGGQYMTIHGTDGMLEITTPFHPVPASGDQPSHSKIIVVKDGKREDMSVPFDKHHFTYAIEQFQRFVRNGEPFPFDTMADALDQAKTMDACLIAAQENRWVELAQL